MRATTWDVGGRCRRVVGAGAPLLLAAAIVVAAGVWSTGHDQHDHAAHDDHATPGGGGHGGAGNGDAGHAGHVAAPRRDGSGAGSAGGAGGGVQAAHEHDEGIVLAAVAVPDEAVVAGGRCPEDAPVRRYDVAAIAVEITLNRYLDHDPDGRMYVLESDLAAVRAEEEANAAARATGAPPAVSLGLQGDAIQPLTLRVRPGECLRVRLRNDLPAEPASFHLHGAPLVVADGGRPAIASEPSAMVPPGTTVTYEWAVPATEPEATHLVHSHGDTRRQSAHGLFGAVVVEPAGATWRDALTGDPDTTSWSAVVEPADGPAFREFVTYYHEIGTESESARGADGAALPLVDPLTGSYKPAGRALNYRSEPFLHRLQLQVDDGRTPDESLAYSSYAFGDPATPIMRAYVGEPVKQRVVHGGSEVTHVHHVHGGSIRWPRQPGVDDRPPITSVEKHPPLLPGASERTDSQSVGPSETFDVEPECGAGGCQHSVGDVLYHCHIAHHYLSGMWGIWRVYNTLQDGPASTDQLPPLAALPDPTRTVPPAVTSDRLPEDLRERIERSLPPPGVPGDGDASVWDWTRRGDVYLGEPQDPRTWPGHTSTGTARPPLLFHPHDGRLAYPHLRPHLGRRPAFAPGHGPAPYLDPGGGRPDVPAPGESGDGAVCPAGTRIRDLDLTAIDVPIVLNADDDLVDPAGMLFVRREERDEVLADPAAREPLVVRTNAVADCVDVTLTSEVADAAHNGGLSKVNAHIHFVQFDVQGSDGVDAGFNYEQSVRPWTAESEPVTAPARAGDTRLAVGDPGRFRPGALVMVGVDTADRAEVRTVAAVEDRALVLAEPLEHGHARGERVTVEFVRYRWYPDVQFGTAFFHDHVNAIVSGQHGLWGALVAEPPDATWHDPDTGEELRSGAIADIHTSGTVSADVTGSFRELVAFLQDDNPVTSEGRSPGSSLGLRVEPLDPRVGDDPATAFDSTTHGDPATPLLRALTGDPVVIRALVAGTNEVHTLHVDGHGTRAEPWSDRSPPVATAHLGISERRDLVLPSAGGPARLAGDYLLRAGGTSKLREGTWSLLRVLAADDADAPRPLPGAPDVRADSGGAAGAGVCPEDAPVRGFDVTAVEVPLAMLDGRPGTVFVATPDADAVRSGVRPAEPLVLRAAVGDCVVVDLRNDTTRPVSFEPDLIVFDPAERAVGRNGGTAVPPGGRRTSRFHAHPGFGTATVLVLDGGDPLEGPARGGYAAIAVAEEGARFTDPVTGATVATGWRVDVATGEGDTYRDAVLFLQEQDPAFGTHRMPYRDDVEGPVGINYATAGLPVGVGAGAGGGGDVGEGGAVGGGGGGAGGGGAVGGSGGDSGAGGDPSTPLVEAYAGDAVRLRVLLPANEQAQVFTVEGHRWPLEPRPGSTLVGARLVGPLETLTIDLDGGAGGPARLVGDYRYGTHREAYREAGLWGLLRVHEPCVERSLQRLAGGGPPACAAGAGIASVVAALGAAGVIGMALVLRRPRRPIQRPSPPAAPVPAP